MVRHRAPVTDVSSAPLSAGAASVTQLSLGATGNLTTGGAATSFGGGLHLTSITEPRDKLPIKIDPWRASVMVGMLLDASRLHLNRDVGSMTILFRNPDDADWVMQALAMLRSET